MNIIVLPCLLWLILHVNIALTHNYNLPTLLTQTDQLYFINR
jgi:hypothetical protein